MASTGGTSTVKAIFVLGSTTSATLSGGLLFTTCMHVPAYIKNPSEASLLVQWQTMGAVGKAIVPPLALVASGANFVNSYLTAQGQRYRFMAAGLLSLAILPYTTLTLAPINAEFEAGAAGREEEEEGQGRRRRRLGHTSVRDLCLQWSYRSAVRGLLFLASAIVSCDALLGFTIT